VEVRTNKIGDIRSFYRRKLAEMFTEREADILLFQLLMEYTGYSKAELLSRPEQTISESELLKIHFGVKELLKHKPIQYVVGKAEFYGLTFIVNSKVLIPRPETEELVDKAMKNIPENESFHILDVGTGSGCIAVAIKKYRPLSRVTAVDISEFALEVAAANADLNNVSINFKKIDFLNPASIEKLDPFDVIVANPPYVRPSEKIQMGKNVLDYEPPSALFVSETNPLAFYEAIAKFGKTHLLPDGKIFLEINQYLSHETLELFHEQGYDKPSLTHDLFGNPRILTVLT
jgi:release factor glutamine methyltransferase